VLNNYSMAKISVITCCTAGREDFLLEAYHSLLSQTFTDWEWLLQVNQGFKMPEEILLDERVSAQFQNGIFIAAINRNWALARSTAPLVAVLDDDDILTNNSLLIRKEALDKYRDAAFSFGRHRHLGKK
jgi:glycosyltransferase involved in cell wall biosynthesis